ncbi:uncharacterized protein BJ212DRAFT_1397245 [Suillus subaureus]|uniref:Uncharacterized protein n=1 Tax=Suillus subaureus TaxID=48587 RepID=A0A9P7DTS9_9AGAM|nr:uncharacterized protein BJ212DRAFT_1397245 [Suillus subaureus]KAG1802980.1 hypothetical protein BJ212DRAFT_1397245 [Suillus subaureus]
MTRSSGSSNPPDLSNVVSLQYLPPLAQAYSFMRESRAHPRHYLPKVLVGGLTSDSSSIVKELTQ